MSMKDDLKAVFDSVVKKDDVAAAAAFSAYIDQKSIEVLKGLTEEKSPIQLKGTDVLVNGKKVGNIKHNAEQNKGIEYTPTGGEKQKFAKLGDLYAQLGKEHKLSESASGGIVKDYESDIQKLPNRPKMSKLKAYTSKNGPGLDADGDHDGEMDGDQADEKREAPVKKLVAKVEAEKKIK